MKTIKIAFVAVAVLFLGACAASKKHKKAVASSTPAATTTAPVANVPASPISGSPATAFMHPKPASGIYEPGNEELTAIQTQYKDVTLATLKEGYVLYAQGACINCHNAKAIYQFNEADWKGIVADMGQKAMLSASQADAVYKYVLSIKATQPK